MSVYFLRHGELVKIGFSSDIGQRIKTIMAAVPGKVEFVGYMPGERDVEAHFHEVFGDSRFSGEWFHTTVALEQVMEILLRKEILEEVSRYQTIGARRADPNNPIAATSDRMRVRAAREWPLKNHKQRMLAIADALRWPHRRVRSVYNCDPGTVLRQAEAEQLTAWMADAETMSPVPLRLNPKETEDG